MQAYTKARSVKPGDQLRVRRTSFSRCLKQVGDRWQTDVPVVLLKFRIYDIIQIVGVHRARVNDYSKKNVDIVHFIIVTPSSADVKIHTSALDDMAWVFHACETLSSHKEDNFEKINKEGPGRRVCPSSTW